MKERRGRSEGGREEREWRGLGVYISENTIHTRRLKSPFRNDNPKNELATGGRGGGGREGKCDGLGRTFVIRTSSPRSLSLSLSCPWSLVSTSCRGTSLQCPTNENQPRRRRSLARVPEGGFVILPPQSSLSRRHRSS